MKIPAGCFRTKCSGFSLIELITAIGIICILAAVLFSSLAPIRERADNAACLQNLRKIGQGMLQYAGENDGHFPPHWGNDGSGPTLAWYGFIAPYVNGWEGDLSKPVSKDFFCPSTHPRYREGKTYTSTVENARGMSYGYNYLLLTRNAGAQQSFRSMGIDKLSKLVLACDIPLVNGTETGVSLPGFMGQYLLYPADAVLSKRHSGNCNLVFADGHVESRDPVKLTTPDGGFDAGNWDPRY